MAVKKNIRIITKNHAAYPEIGFLAKSISKSNGCGTAMPTAWELRKFWRKDEISEKFAALYEMIFRHLRHQTCPYIWVNIWEIMYLKGVRMFGWLRGDWSESFIVHIEPRVRKSWQNGRTCPQPDRRLTQRVLRLFVPQYHNIPTQTESASSGFKNNNVYYLIITENFDFFYKVYNKV